MLFPTPGQSSEQIGVLDPIPNQPSSSSGIRWEKRDPGRWSPENATMSDTTHAMDENYMDEIFWQETVEDAVWENTGRPIWCNELEAMELFGEVEENIIGKVSFEQDPSTGLTSTTVQKVSELPQSQISSKDWPRFHQATVDEWKSTLDMGAVTILSLIHI